MDAETVREHCLSLTSVTEDAPFGPDVLAFRIGGKIFLLLSLDTVPTQFNAKCDPERAIELRESHSAIRPGYHMNKRHWNTIVLDGTLPSALVRDMIDASFALVAGSLSKKQRAALGLTS